MFLLFLVLMCVRALIYQGRGSIKQEDSGAAHDIPSGEAPPKRMKVEQDWGTLFYMR